LKPFLGPSLFKVTADAHFARAEVFDPQNSLQSQGQLKKKENLDTANRLILQRKKLLKKLVCHSGTANCADAEKTTRQYVPYWRIFAQFYGYQSHNKLEEKRGRET